MLQILTLKILGTPKNDDVEDELLYQLKLIKFIFTALCLFVGKGPNISIHKDRRTGCL